MLKFLITTFVFLFFNVQSQKDSVIVNPDSSFKAGVYLKYSDFRHNTPISIDSISCKNNNDSKDIYSKLKNNSYVTYTKNGVKKEVHVNSFWGYIENKKLHVYYDGEFYPVAYEGAICLFLAMTNQMTSSYGTSNNSFKTSRVAAPFLISYYNGIVIKGTPKNLLKLFKNEPEIYKEYKSMVKETQMGLMKQYIQRYNKLHPVYVLK